MATDVARLWSRLHPGGVHAKIENPVYVALDKEDYDNQKISNITEVVTKHSTECA